MYTLIRKLLRSLHYVLWGIFTHTCTYVYILCVCVPGSVPAADCVMKLFHSVLVVAGPTFFPKGFCKVWFFRKLEAQN